LERAKGFEPSTPTLARLCSTTELHPHPSGVAGGGYMPHSNCDCNRIFGGKSKCHVIAQSAQRRVADRCLLPHVKD